MSLNLEQTRALAFLNKFESSYDRLACLAGYAGVGKTYLISQWLQDIPPRVKLCVATPTHEALRILMQKCQGERPLIFYTLSALLGEAPIKNEDTGEKTFECINERKDEGFDIIVVDECSMVNQKVFNTLCKGRSKILFVGDPAQLPPVKDQEPSPTFNVPVKFHMTQIVRQAEGNPIIQLSLTIRQKMQNRHPVCFVDVLDALTNDRERLTTCVKHSLYDYVEWAYRKSWTAPILAFKNKTVVAHNAAMHRRIYPDAPLFAVGESILSYETKWYDSQPILYNGEVVSCVSCTPIRIREGLGFETYEVRIQKENGKRATFWVAGDDMKLVEKRTQAMKRCAYLKKVQYMNPNLKSEYNNLSNKLDYFNRFVRLRHTYSRTVHKAQGSTFDAVFIDWSDIATAKDDRMYYVAVTRAAECLVVVQPPSRRARGAAPAATAQLSSSRARYGGGTVALH